MKRIDLYMAREMIVPFLIGQGAVVLMLTGTVLYNNADTFLNYRIPAQGVARIAFYFLPYLVSLTMPVATAIAASLAVSRLARDSEITVMRASGISLRRIFLPIWAAGLLLSVGDFAFGERVVPWATRQYERTMSQLSRSMPFLAPRERQVVQSPDRKYTVYIGRMALEGGRALLYDVTMLAARGAQPTPTVIVAPRAAYADGVWTLYDASVHAYEDAGRRETYTHADRLEIPFRLAERTFNLIYLQLPLYSQSATSTWSELGRRIADERRAGWVNPQDLLDYHFKLSVPFSCLVFALVCPPMSLRFARAGSFMGVLLSIILVFVYWNTLLAAKILGARYPNVLPPAVAGWGQNALFAGIGLFALWREE